MTTSRHRATLDDPTKVKRIRDSDFTYIIARHKLSAFSAVKRELENSGLTQTELANRLGCDPGQLSRMLSGPGNWRIDTIAKLLWAISGARETYEFLDYPMKKAKRNDVYPEFVSRKQHFGSSNVSSTSGNSGEFDVNNNIATPTTAPINSGQYFTTDENKRVAEEV